MSKIGVWFIAEERSFILKEIMSARLRDSLTVAPGLLLMFFIMFIGFRLSFPFC